MIFSRQLFRNRYPLPHYPVAMVEPCPWSGPSLSPKPYAEPHRDEPPVLQVHVPYLSKISIDLRHLVRLMHKTVCMHMFVSSMCVANIHLLGCFRSSRRLDLILRLLTAQGFLLSAQAREGPVESAAVVASDGVPRDGKQDDQEDEEHVESARVRLVDSMEGAGLREEEEVALAVPAGRAEGGAVALGRGRLRARVTHNDTS